MSEKFYGPHDPGALMERKFVKENSEEYIGKVYKREGQEEINTEWSLTEGIPDLTLAFLMEYEKLSKRMLKILNKKTIELKIKIQ